jgi:hypothetical protein
MDLLLKTALLRKRRKAASVDNSSSLRSARGEKEAGGRDRDRAKQILHADFPSLRVFSKPQEKRRIPSTVEKARRSRTFNYLPARNAFNHRDVMSTANCRSASGRSAHRQRMIRSPRL